MPNIIQKYDFNEISFENLYKESLDIFNEMGLVNIQQAPAPTNPASKIISAVAPSIWGWGGMKLSLTISHADNTSSLELNGYISQIGVTPLTKKMDEFLNRLKDKLKLNYNYDFNFVKVTAFLPKYKLRFTKADLVAITLIIVVTSITTFAEIFGGINGIILTGPVLCLGYYLGKKYLYKSKNSQDKI